MHLHLNPVNIKIIIYTPGLEAAHDPEGHGIDDMTFMQVKYPTIVGRNYSPFTIVIV
jgi:hypothetical protein